MLLVDVNVLIYAVNHRAEHHAVAHSWLDDALNGQETVGFSWAVLLAFLRISTHPAIFQHPLSVEQACDEVRAWLAQPSAVVLDPTGRHMDVLSGLLLEVGSAGNLVSDAHLAALAIDHDAELVSFDTDFARFPGVRWTRPIDRRARRPAQAFRDGPERS